MTVPFAVKGWCPGALRPMPTGDGLILRVRVTAGVLFADTADALASLAATYGNGLMEISRRANLQLRGLDAAGLPEVWQGLAGLGLLDTDAGAEAVRNVLVSPLAHPSTRALAAALEVRLAATPALRALPPKFGLLVDDGTWPALDAVPADIRFAARAGHWHVELPAAGGLLVLAAVAPEAIPDTAEALARAFLALRGADRRMAALVARIGGAAVAGAAGLAPPPVLRRAEPEPEVIGRHDTSAGPVIAVGIALGQMTAGQLQAAAALARRYGTGEIRLTPFRALMIPIKGEADGALGLLADAGFVVAPDDPRRAVVACAGGPACLHGEVPARADALALAEIAARLPGTGVRVHVSGCAKGCAHAGVAPATLVGRGGRYDLVPAGRAGDPAVATGLTRAAAAALLEEWGRTDGDL